MTGVRRPAEDIDGVGEIAVVKLNPVEGADKGASFRDMTFTSWPRADSLSIEVEETFVGAAVEDNDGWLSDQGDLSASGAGTALWRRLDGEGGTDGGPCGRGDMLSKEKPSSNH